MGKFEMPMSFDYQLMLKGGKGKGKYCLIKTCCECNRIMHDTYTEKLLNRNWGGIGYERNNGHPYFYPDKNKYRCRECIGNLNTFSIINECECCGKLGSTRKVQIRNDCYGWNCEHNNRGYIIGDTKSKNMLCMGCWNKVKAIIKKQEEARDNKILLGQIQRRIANERKTRKREDQDNGRTEGLSSHHDGGGKERRP